MKYHTHSFNSWHTACAVLQAFGWEPVLKSAFLDKPPEKLIRVKNRYTGTRGKIIPCRGSGDRPATYQLWASSKIWLHRVRVVRSKRNG